MINAVEARENAKKNSKYVSVMAMICAKIEKASQEGKFSVKVRPEYEFTFTCCNELEAHGFKVEDVKQGIYPTGEIEIKW